MEFGRQVNKTWDNFLDTTVLHVHNKQYYILVYERKQQMKPEKHAEREDEGIPLAHKHRRPLFSASQHFFATAAEKSSWRHLDCLCLYLSTLVGTNSFGG